MTLNTTNLLADLSILSKTGDIRLSRKINTYTVEKSFSLDVFTFVIGTDKENMAFDFKKNGKKIFPPNIEEFIRMIEEGSEAQPPREDVPEATPAPELSDDYFEELAHSPSKKIQKEIKGQFKNVKNKPEQNFDESDLNQAAQNFAMAILQKQAESKSVNEKIAALEEMIKNIGTPAPKEIKINELPEIKLDQHACAILEDLLRAAYTRQNAYIFGPAGCGKTTAAKQVAKAMELPFGYICLTAGASETWLFGRNTPNGFIEGQFSLLYKNGGVFLADEMDAADSNLLIALNTAIDSDELLNPMSGERIKKHKDFVFIGAGNTNGLGATGNYNGRNRLDASTLSRFVFFEMDYDEQLEKALCLDKNIYEALIKTRRYLVERKSENFITTRDFIKLSKMFTAGSSYNFVANSLTTNFSEVERNEVKKFWQFKTPKKQVTQDEIPF